MCLIMTSSSTSKRRWPLIASPNGFFDKGIHWWKRKRTVTPEKNDDKKQKSMQTASIPFVDGLSQKVRRLCPICRPTVHFLSMSSTQQLYAVEDSLPTDHSTRVVHSIKCNTCEKEYVGETMRALHVRCKGRRDAFGWTPREVGDGWTCTWQRQWGATRNQLVGCHYPWTMPSTQGRERSEKHSK